ncbi:hypothetical protein [Streptomyces sp. enrichment culture]|uniref:hypothetical protein n=1 Tax=Streptomyces sp. enrichment culture TaxID=1795815 RepID=UPI003F54603B
MSDDQTPREQAAEAVADVDRAMNDPVRRHDAVGALFDALGAAVAQHAQEKRAARVRWRNRPEAKARRSAAAQKAAATRVRRLAAERAAELAECERDLRMPEVHCPHIDFTPFGETECALEPGHGPDEDHEDIDGHSWVADDCDADCGVACGY